MMLAPGVDLVVDLRVDGLVIVVTTPEGGRYRWRITLCGRCHGWRIVEGDDAGVVPAEYPTCICRRPPE